MQTAYKSFPQSSTANDPVTGAAYVSYYDMFTVGAGYLDVAAALANTYTPSGNALSPIASFNPIAGTMSLNFDPASVWASLGVSGTRAAWGASAVSSTSSIAGTNSIWANNCIWANNSVWANNSIWASNSIWPSNSISATDTTQSDTNVMINGEN
jgi:serine protease AprX